MMFTISIYLDYIISYYESVYTKGVTSYCGILVYMSTVFTPINTVRASGSGGGGSGGTTNGIRIHAKIWE